MSVDTVSIPLGPEQYFIYPKFQTVETQDSLYYLGYNMLHHSIDIFNLTSQKHWKTIPLAKEGPHGIPDFISFNATSLDNLYVMSTYQISQVNGEGEIIEKTVINSAASPVKGHKSNDAFFWIEKDQPIHFDDKSNTIYGLYHSMEYDRCSRRRYKNDRLVSAIDLESKRMSRLPVAYPVDKRDDYYGFTSALYMTWDGDSLIYNFQNDPNIHVYDLNRDQTTIFNGSSDYSKNTVQPMSWDQCMDGGAMEQHLIKNVLFEPVIRDPYRKLYYRFHRKELPSSSNPMDYNFSDKPLYISIFDNGLSKTGERLLASRPYPSRISFASKEGLYVAAPSGENTLNFHIFKVSLVKGNHYGYQESF